MSEIRSGMITSERLSLVRVMGYSLFGMTGIKYKYKVVGEELSDGEVRDNLFDLCDILGKLYYHDR